MWTVILFAALTAFLFRLTPFLFHKSALLNNKNGRFYRFLNYSAQAMMGYLVFGSTFGYQPINQWLEHFSLQQGLQLALLIACFIWVIYTQRLLSGLLLFIGIYAVGMMLVS